MERFGSLAPFTCDGSLLELQQVMSLVQETEPGECVPHKYSSDGTWQDMTPAEIRELKAAVEAQRLVSTPFEIHCGGRRLGPDWEQERAFIRSLAEAGVTCWEEFIEPDALEDLEACRQYVKQGPLRIE
jgi:hypothetical protein